MKHTESETRKVNTNQDKRNHNFFIKIKSH